MFFTQEDYIKIEKWLKNRAVPDSVFNSTCEIDRKDFVTIIQEGQNRKVPMFLLAKWITRNYTDFFYNITEVSGKEKLTLKDAVSLVPIEKRVKGLVITFESCDGTWHIMQYKGKSLSRWDYLPNWHNIFEGFVADYFYHPDEEDLTFKKDGNRKFLIFKDREYNPEVKSGKGRKILRKNITGECVGCNVYDDDEEQVIYHNYLSDEDFNSPNTSYVIRYDFEGKGLTTIPKNCELIFEGGSIKLTQPLNLQGCRILGMSGDIREYFGNNVRVTDAPETKVRSRAGNVISLYNPAIGQILWEGDFLWCYTGTQRGFVDLLSNKDINITVDELLSITSENPVQNKVITTELNKKATIEEVSKKASKDEVALKADKTYVDTSLAGKAEINHTHNISDVNSLQTELNSKATKTELATKAAISHSHPISDINQLQTTLDGKASKIELSTKANVSHSHTIDDVNELNNRLDDLSRLATESSNGYLSSSMYKYIQSGMSLSEITIGSIVGNVVHIPLGSIHDGTIGSMDFMWRDVNIDVSTDYPYIITEISGPSENLSFIICRTAKKYKNLLYTFSDKKITLINNALIATCGGVNILQKSIIHKILELPFKSLAEKDASNVLQRNLEDANTIRDDIKSCFEQATNGIKLIKGGTEKVYGFKKNLLQNTTVGFMLSNTNESVSGELFRLQDSNGYLNIIFKLLEEDSKIYLYINDTKVYNIEYGNPYYISFTTQITDSINYVVSLWTYGDLLKQVLIANNNSINSVSKLIFNHVEDVSRVAMSNIIIYDRSITSQNDFLDYDL